MTEETAQFLDITPFMDQGVAPQLCLPREPDSIWRVRQQPIQPGVFQPQPQAWSTVKEGDLVRIPLIPYRTSSRNPEEVLLAAIQIGQRNVREFSELLRIHLVVGDPIQDLEEHNAFRFWLGVAVRTH